MKAGTRSVFDRIQRERTEFQPGFMRTFSTTASRGADRAGFGGEAAESSLPMNLAPTSPPLTPPRRGTGQPVLLPSWEGLGVGSGAQCAHKTRGTLSPEVGPSPEGPYGFEPFIISCLGLCRSSLTLTGGQAIQNLQAGALPLQGFVWLGSLDSTFPGRYLL